MEISSKSMNRSCVSKYTVTGRIGKNVTLNIAFLGLSVVLTHKHWLFE